MRIGVVLDYVVREPGLHGLIAAAQAAEAAGFDSAWVSNTYDALTVLALAGRDTGRIALGSFVVPVLPRHPVALAEQALAVQAACAGRLRLGIGLSHRHAMAGQLGLDYHQPARQMREYLTVLHAALRGEPIELPGEWYRVALPARPVPAPPPPVILAAHGPAMLRLGYELAAGTVTWLGGARYLRELAAPARPAALTRRAASAGPAATLVALPVCVTADAAAARRAADRLFGHYAALPAYRETLVRAGASLVSELALIGSAAEIEAGLRELAVAGATDFIATPFAPFDATAFVSGRRGIEPTWELLADRARVGRGDPPSAAAT